MTTTDSSAACALRPAALPGGQPLPDVGAVAVVYPALPPATAQALGGAGVTRLGRTGDVEIWVRYPAGR